jgi:hypothetical protein
MVLLGRRSRDGWQFQPLSGAAPARSGHGVTRRLNPHATGAWAFPPPAAARTNVTPKRGRSVEEAGVPIDLELALASDDEHERRVRLLLLSKAAVLAHRFDRPLAAEMDDDQQS